MHVCQIEEFAFVCLIVCVCVYVGCLFVGVCACVCVGLTSLFIWLFAVVFVFECLCWLEAIVSCFGLFVCACVLA